MPQNILECDYLVIGAGSGGLVVAVGLQKLGRDVAVISENVGGDCTHYGCVPSKTLLHLAKEYQSMKENHEKERFKKTVLKKVISKVQFFVDEEQNIIEKRRYYQGSAKFTDAKTVKVTIGRKTKHIQFRKKCIIATGSSPKRMTLKGYSRRQIITNEEFFYLPKLPTSITIFGGGPIGAELATACVSLDIETHLVSRSFLSNEPKSISQKTLQILKRKGMKYYATRPKRFEKNRLILDNGTKIPETEWYLSAIGRSPNTSIDLEQANISYDSIGIKVNKNFITTNPAVFAIGDCTQNPQFTHLAAHQAKFVLKKISLPFVQKKKRALPWITFTNPPIASVGSLSKEKHIMQYELDFPETDKGKIQNDTVSFGVVAIDIRTGLIQGASLLGELSEDMISVFTLLIDEKIPVMRMTDFITPYPTYSNIFHTLTRDYLQYLAKNWKQYPISTAKQLLHFILH